MTYAEIAHEILGLEAAVQVLLKREVDPMEEALLRRLHEHLAGAADCAVPLATTGLKMPKAEPNKES